MITKLKNWFMDAVSNGGATLLVVAILLAGALGHVAHDPVSDLLSRASSSPSASAPQPDQYQCEDETWTRISGFDNEYGASYTVCSKNQVVIRHFDGILPPFVERTQAQDQGVYPFIEISVEEGIQIANSR